MTINLTPDRDLAPSPLLDFDSPAIVDLIRARNWQALAPRDRIGAAYDFVRDEVAFGYNAQDATPASQVLAEGQGQCNTKAILLMALLRALGQPCRFHAFAITKTLQRGVVPELVYGLAPAEILHSWVEVRLDGRWIRLEGFIIDAPVLRALQARFTSGALCGYGVGTNRLEAPGVAWEGRDTFIQATGIVRDYGLYDRPDDFFALHQQAFGGLRGWLYRHVIRHWMNARVRAMRNGRVPDIPGGPDRQTRQEITNAT